MEENNRSQEPQNPSEGLPNIEPQNTEQINKESTYWETNNFEQNPGYPSEQLTGTSSGLNYGQSGQTLVNAPNGQWTGADTPQSQSSQTPEQFYQYYQQQMNSGSGSQQNYTQPQYSQPAYQPGDNQRPPKKKHRGALVALIVILLLLATAAGTAYAFRDTLSNTLAKLTKSPVEYYSYIEKNTVNAALSDIASSSALQKPDKPVSYEITSDFTINRDTIDPVLQSSLGMSLSDLEDMTGIKLENFGLDALVATDGKIVNETFGLKLNQMKLITAELFMDTSASEIFLRLPELSKAYLSLSAEDTFNSTDLSPLEDLTPELLTDMLSRYSGIIIDDISDVELEENTELSVDTMSTKCTKLTVTISDEDAVNMVIDILEAAREDKDIINLLPMFDMTEGDYQDYVDEAISSCEDSFDELTGDSVEMVVYVNSKGEVIGREFSTDSSEDVIGYTVLSKGNDEEFKIYYTDDAGNDVLIIEGNQSKNDNGGYTGEASMEFNTGDETIPSVSIDVDFSDVRTEKKNNHTYQYGTITISSMDLMGMQMTFNFSVEDDVQKCKFDLQMGAVTIASADITVKYPDDYDVTMPPEDAEIYDTSESYEYGATMNLEDYISNLSEQLGIDLQSLIESFSSGYIY